MSDPTGTNQASEDELIKSKTDWSTPYDEWLVPTLNRFRYGGAIECRAIPSEIQLNIESLIRTEKLKLLAEVRERERSYFITDLELLEHQTGDDEIIAVPVSEITKLEAEL